MLYFSKEAPQVLSSSGHYCPSGKQGGHLLAKSFFSLNFGKKGLVRLVLEPGEGHILAFTLPRLHLEADTSSCPWLLQNSVAT